jgi:hypothetical protein
MKYDKFNPISNFILMYRFPFKCILKPTTPALPFIGILGVTHR